jgi:hypothetical protein
VPVVCRSGARNGQNHPLRADAFAEGVPHVAFVFNKDMRRTLADSTRGPLVDVRRTTGRSAVLSIAFTARHWNRFPVARWFRW